MSEKKIIIIVVVISAIVLFGGAALALKAPKAAEVAVSQEAKVETDSLSHDWGTIPLQGGIVEKTFAIKNAGSAPLQLANVQTSCMCTEAKVIIDGKESPYFGMHSNSPWKTDVQPGQEAKLLVTFDPAFHGPSGIGQITRVVSLETSDENRPNLEFRLTANVVN